MEMMGLTPVEKRGEFWFKRDDLFSVAGVQGGKARSCWTLAQGAAGLITAGSRSSPQINIVAHIAAHLGIPCRAHAPTGTLSPELQDARSVGATIVQHKAGYNNVIIARARSDAEALGWREIPFGMECAEAVTATSNEVGNLPEAAKRLVIPVGSGMSLAGVLTGLRRAGSNLRVLGVCVGADPEKRLDRYAPFWRQMRVTLVESHLAYHEAAANLFNGLTLDPIYEAKCATFMLPGDLLWIVGIRKTVAAAARKATG